MDVEIVDVCVDDEEEIELPIEQIQWADSCLIVYSITDRESFKYAKQLMDDLKVMQPSCAAYLIGNKLDLDHSRVVSTYYNYINTYARYNLNSDLN